MAMDVLSSLVMEAERQGLLNPLAARNMGHRMSLYADDMVLFTMPHIEDLNLLKGILQKFGHISGLCTNLNKSLILHIWCEEYALQQAQQSMNCEMSLFPCKYLGAPLSIKRLMKTGLQPYLDKVADMLPAGRRD